MKATTALLLLIAVVGLTGCGGKPAGSPAAPLSVAEWKAMPADQKYSAEVLERLKEGDPNLQTPEGWEAFNRGVLREARKKDFPTGRRKP